MPATAWRGVARATRAFAHARFSAYVSSIPGALETWREPVLARLSIYSQGIPQRSGGAFRPSQSLPSPTAQYGLGGPTKGQTMKAFGHQIVTVQVRGLRCLQCLTGALLLFVSCALFAQPSAQDNWTLDSRVSLQSGFNPVSQEFKCEIDSDGFLFIRGTEAGINVVQIYDAAGNYVSTPDWLKTDVANYFIGLDGRVYAISAVGGDTALTIRVYERTGELVRSVQMGAAKNGWAAARDPKQENVAIDTDGTFYIVDGGLGFETPSTNFVRVFSSTGTLLREIGGAAGSGASQVNRIQGVVLSPDGRVVLSDWLTTGSLGAIKVFTKDGVFVKRMMESGVFSSSVHSLAAIGPDGCIYLRGYNSVAQFAGYYAFSPLGDLLATFENGVLGTSLVRGGQINAKTGAIYTYHGQTNQMAIWRRGFRTLGANPPKLVPLPNIRSVTQRSSGLIDLDCIVMDGDSATVQTALAAYKNGSGLVRDLVRVPSSTLVEGTNTKLGAGVATGQVQRLTWDPSTSGLSAGNVTFELFARDDRPGLLDLDFLTLPGAPTLVISRIPLTHADMRTAWAWLLASGDPALGRDGTGEITGLGGTFTTTFNSNGTLESRTTAAGRAWLLTKLNVREATAAELTRARQATTTGTPNRFTPGRSQQMGARPKAVNEWTFDSSDQYGTEAWWVVHL